MGKYMINFCVSSKKPNFRTSIVYMNRKVFSLLEPSTAFIMLTITLVQASTPPTRPVTFCITPGPYARGC